MDAPTRRSFLMHSATGLGGAWIAANWPAILAAEEYVRTEAATPQVRFAFFTPEQAVEVDAMAAQIIPTDHTPGAREARVVHFIDRALVTFERDRQADYTRGLHDLARQANRAFPSVSKFSDLIYDQQIQVLTSIEDTPFFNLVRTHTITGFFASPVHGGNFDKVGWELVGYDDSLHHEPPFGYYDALPSPASRAATGDAQ
ncbi:MAG: gluconate 2-dehydrogenase subunit 3 family protein [Gemmatimonadota bacterium]|nr:gluconate 2-dehydrogenase subunit 3 family protein [Gemmatimonadota bacterium]MDH3423906.1 gluconate 2-dehydrogenase subunit 3 family protein [Gemmatimonadota bacterium]